MKNHDDEGIEGWQTRTVLTGMIVHDSVAAMATSVWDSREGRFDAPWCNQIGQWVVDYYNRYAKAPGSHIEGSFRAWEEDNADKQEVCNMVASFLSTLSNDYDGKKEETSPDYVIDQASDLFNRVHAARLLKRLQGDLNGNGRGLSDFYKRVSQFDRLSVASCDGIDLFTDEAAVRRAFDKERRKPIVTFDGPLGEFFGPDLSRGAFVCFLGPAKRGKSYWLLELAFQAVSQRRRTVFFETGDLTQDQISDRFLARVSNHPVDAKVVKYPTDLVVHGKEPVSNFKDVQFERPLTPDHAWSRCLRLMNKIVRSRESYFKLFCYPNTTLTTSEIRSILTGLRRKDWKADVVAIDYMDILAHPNNQPESREGVNANWKSMRAINQEFDCLLATATQSNADGYSRDSLGMDNFSEDNRKNAHVSAMYGINQRDSQKDDMVMSLNCIVNRHRAFNRHRHVYTVSCLDLGRIAVCSAWPERGAETCNGKAERVSSNGRINHG